MIEISKEIFNLYNNPDRSPKNVLNLKSYLLEQSVKILYIILNLTNQIVKS